MTSKKLFIIPCRLESSRLKQKLLKRIDDETTVIERCIEQTLQAAQGAFPGKFHIVVAVDEPILLNWLKSRYTGADDRLSFVRTSVDHINGTARASEVINMPEYSRYKHVFIIQGDEVLVHSSFLIDMYLQLLEAEVVTILKPNYSLVDAENPTVVKSVYNVLSKEVVSLYRDRVANPHQGFYEHIGMYLWRSDVLKTFGTRPDTPMMLKTNVELLKALEHGIDVKAVITYEKTLNINTQEDLRNAIDYIATEKKQRSK